ncbi:MAG: sulfite exporter TauE/SafE family protein [Gammaproteobacteria bacterium]|nr:sulfite exporter TauE/SafE family protein [Gammaproteobacteria bacterium]
MLALALLTITCIIAYIFEIIFGLAGTIIMILIMTFLYDSKTLVVYSVLPQILVGAIGLIRTKKTIESGFFIKMVLFASLGAVVGITVFYYLPQTLFHQLLASAITLFGLFLVISPKILKFNSIVARLLDITAGASQALFGISGPIAMTRLMGTFEDKTVIRNYALAFFLTLNIFRVGGYVINSTFTPDILEMIYISAPFIAIALWFSNHLHYKINDVLFKKVVSWVILFGGVTMLLKQS